MAHAFNPSTWVTRPAGPVIRGSRGDLLLRTKWGVEGDEGLVRITTRRRSGMHQSPKCISQAQGLNAQAKGEVQRLSSVRGRAINCTYLGSYTGKQELGGIRVWSGHRR